ncbi:MAG: hypothetical protein IT534_08475 [Bauldia sp.]|nr:hypothetical protein [Bauldia sp.]
MARAAGVRNPGGNESGWQSPRRSSTADALGAALLAAAQPDLFGDAASPAAAVRLRALRRRRLRSRRLAAAKTLLAEPWCIGEAGAAPDAIALARRWLRRHPERDRADPAPPLLTARQEAAEWHAEEEAADAGFRRDGW